MIFDLGQRDGDALTQQSKTGFGGKGVGTTGMYSGYGQTLISEHPHRPWFWQVLGFWDFLICL